MWRAKGSGRESPHTDSTSDCSLPGSAPRWKGSLTSDPFDSKLMTLVCLHQNWLLSGLWGP
ncbi:mCG146894 [Mus musculus]|nr:mCG146894 [Mus musculus]